VKRILRKSVIASIITFVALGCSDISKNAAAQTKAIASMAADEGLFAAVKDCTDCPPMIRIPPLPGTHTPLFAARHELTWEEYLVAVRQVDCPLPQASIRMTFDKANLDQLADNYPLNYLPPDDFNCYLDWINSTTGKRYRLPSSAEWEHLARAGSATRYPWGDELSQGNTAIFDHYDRNHYPRHRPTDPRFQAGRNLGVLPVESFKPNAWGIYDVIGNVAEYVSERKSGSAKCLEKFGKAQCEMIAIRGGSKSSVAYRIEPGKPTRSVGHDVDHMENIGWTYLRLGDSAAQSNGYRLVRNDHE